MRTTETGRYLANLLDEAERQRRAVCVSSPREVKAFRRRVEAGEVREVRKNCYARTAVWKSLERDERERWIIRAVASRSPDTVFGYYSAAAMHGLPVSYKLLGPLHVFVDSAAHARSSDSTIRHVRNHVASVELDGVRVTPLLQTVIDCMRIAPFTDGLALADALMSGMGFDRRLFQEIVLECAEGRHGVARALRSASYADGRAESGGESIARAVMIENGTPPSDIQVEFMDPVDGEHRMRSDFLFELSDGSSVLGELDGKIKYLDERYREGRSLETVMLDERQRESRLSMLGFKIVRFTMQDVWRTGRLAHLLATAGVVPGGLMQGEYRDATPDETQGGCPTMRQAKLGHKVDLMIQRGLAREQRKRKSAA